MSVATKTLVQVRIGAGGWYPAVLLDHEGYQLGYGRILVVDDCRLQNWCPNSDASHLPSRRSEFEEIPNWYIDYWEHGALFWLGDATSRSGCHRVETSAWPFCRYRVVTRGDHLRTFSPELLTHVRNWGGWDADVVWHVSAGVSGVFGLEKVGLAESSWHFSGVADALQSPPLVGQGRLTVYPIELRFENESVALPPLGDVRTIYNHTIAATPNYAQYVRWFDQENRRAVAVLRLVNGNAVLKSPDHDELTLETGDYLLAHPIPSRTVD